MCQTRTGVYPNFGRKIFLTRVYVFEQFLVTATAANCLSTEVVPSPFLIADPRVHFINWSKMEQ